MSYFSDYGSRNSSETTSPWGSQETWLPLRSHVVTDQTLKQTRERSLSSIDVTAKKSIDAVMQEFRMNGSDSPYDPEEDGINRRSGLMGLGPSSAYLRQKSWPAPERSPLPSLPRMSHSQPSTEAIQSPMVGVSPTEMLTLEQLRVLSSLPRVVLESLIRALQTHPDQDAFKDEPPLRNGCAFCRSNGERAAWYQSHVLRSAGRVCCPVLRALVCSRCGATGDRAHTINYCPMATQHERERSAAIMRSIRTASGRRRAQPRSSVEQAEHYVRFGQTTASVIQDGNAYASHELIPLDPTWAALEQKLML